MSLVSENCKKPSENTVNLNALQDVVIFLQAAKAVALYHDIKNSSHAGYFGRLDGSVYCGRHQSVTTVKMDSAYVV